MGCACSFGEVMERQEAGVGGLHAGAFGLSSANANVTLDISAVNSKLASALHEITRLTNVVAKLQLSKSGKFVPPGRATATKMAVGPTHYFWTHIHLCLHLSHLCTIPAANHNKGEKASDTKGGSNTNKNV